MHSTYRHLAVSLLPVLVMGCAKRTANDATAPRVTGTAAYRERIALPPQAVLDVTLEDVSRADARSEVVGSARKQPAGNPPMAFEISYDPSRIVANHSYVVRARVTVDGELWFTTDQSYPVITGSNGTQVTLNMVSARGGSSGGAVASPDLVNTYWKLMELGGKAVTVTDNQREPHIVLRPDPKQVNGSGGCNRLFGSYETRGDTLTFAGVGSTKMACPSGMDTEAAFLPALGRVARWRISGHQLELSDSTGAVLARFEARAMK